MIFMAYYNIIAHKIGSHLSKGSFIKDVRTRGEGVCQKWTPAVGGRGVEGKCGRHIEENLLENV